jgi:ankyrin repeat protein
VIKDAHDSGSFHLRFRWVFCQLETLQHCLPQNIPRTLRELPTSLDETYERVLKEIVTANRHHAYRLLHCLTVARRPLRVEELAEILALDFDGAKDGIPELKEDWRWEDQKETVLSTCSSLIAVVAYGDRRVVQFSHFSVKEFLTSDRLATSRADVSLFHIPLETAHTIIVKACLGILLRSDTGMDVAKAERISPLSAYAAEHWVGHAQFEHVSAHIQDGMRDLFDPAKPYFGAWLKSHDIDSGWYSFRGLYMDTPRGSPLYYAALCGFRDLVAHLVDENPQHVNARLGQNLSPLVAALLNKHFYTAELLYRHGADVGIRGSRNNTLLHAASIHGFVEIGQWLLARGGDANSLEDNLETPLHLAAKNGRLEFVRMLLMHSIDVNAKNKDNCTSLHLASQGGHAKIVWLLLRHEADIATRNLKHNTPLHLASSNVSPETVRLLIEHGADVNAPNANLKTPLHLASWWVRKTARLLLQLRADVKPQKKSYSYPRKEPGAKVKTVQVLLEHGADVTARDDTRSTPLHLALSRRSPKIAQLLIEHGADVDALDGNLKTALHLASSYVSGQMRDFFLQC